MELTRAVIKRLVDLQDKDSSLDRLQAEIDQVPVDSKALQDAVEGEKVMLDGAKKKILELEKGKKTAELDLGQKEEAIRKHQKDLNQIKSNDAFRALQSEIDQAKEACGGLETRILEHMDQLDGARKEEKAVQAELKKLQDKAGSDIGVLEGKLKELQARHAAETKTRDESAAHLDDEVLKIYMHMRGRGKPQAVVAVVDTSCGACRMRLSPNIIVQTTKGTSLVHCESCQRILYKPDTLVGVEMAQRDRAAEAATEAAEAAAEQQEASEEAEPAPSADKPAN